VSVAGGIAQVAVELPFKDPVFAIERYRGREFRGTRVEWTRTNPTEMEGSLP